MEYFSCVSPELCAVKPEDESGGGMLLIVPDPQFVWYAFQAFDAQITEQAVADTFRLFAAIALIIVDIAGIMTVINAVRAPDCEIRVSVGH
jgi:hypothetical protein